MSATASEAYLHDLAQRTFLKLWAIPNPFRAPGREISDLIVAFGDDIVVFSDKACEYRARPDPGIAWERWRREAVDGSIAQLKGATRRLRDPSTGIFLDSNARARLPFPVADPDKRRLHLVAIARPSPDPAVRPSGWQGLVSVGKPSRDPFSVEPLWAGDGLVHLFDGETIDLLLDELDTARDFIDYLTGRERALREAQDYAFREADLLAEAILNWGSGSGLTASIPPLGEVSPGAWTQYADSDRAARTRALNLPSRAIDNLIEHFHSAYLSGGFLGGRLPGFERHEFALRLLAAESRFARRIIAAPLHDLRKEEVQSIPWLATVPSPGRPGLRYVWLTYPDLSAGTTPQMFEALVDAHLSHAILATCVDFPSEIIVGIAVPNLAATENVYAMKVLDGSNWTEEERRLAQDLRRDGPFGPPTPTAYEHIP